MLPTEIEWSIESDNEDVEIVGPTDEDTVTISSPTCATYKLTLVITVGSTELSCSTTGAFEDTEDPEITCPPDIGVDCTASTLPADTGTATADDNCGAEVDYDDEVCPGNCLSNYVIKRTWTATDACGLATAAEIEGVFGVSGVTTQLIDGFPPTCDIQLESAPFMAVVLGQKANVFACRSSTRWPGALGWTTNRLLFPAGALELTFSLVILFVGPIAAQFDHAPPPLEGWLVAAASIGVVLGVDAAYKRWRSRRRTVTPGGGTSAPR